MSRLPLSNSRLEHAACLRQFHGLYILKAPDPRGVPAMLGGFFHAAASAFLQAMREATDTGDQNRLALMEGVFDTLWGAGRPKEFLALEESHRDDLRELCMGFARNEPWGPTFQRSEMKFAVNEQWEPVDWMHPRVFYRMIVDRLDIRDTTVTITDYKTSWRADSEDEVARNPQFTGYAAGIKALLPNAGTIKVVVNFVRPRILRQVTIEPQNIDKARQRIERESDRIERARARDDWPATPGQQCAYCPAAISSKCPAREAALLLRAPETPEEAQSLVAAWVLKKRVLDETAARLKAYVGMNGPVHSEGISAEFARTERRTFPGGPTLDALEQAGVDENNWHEYVNGDAKRLDKAAKNNEKLAALLPSIQKVSAYSRWTIGQSDDEPEVPCR